MLSKKTIKYIQSLSHKKFRDEHATFIAETPKIVEEFLQADRYIFESVFGTEQWFLKNQNLLKNLSENKKVIVDESDLARISQLKTPHDVLAVINIPQETIPEKMNELLVLMLDDVQDPGNVGTIIRIADWFGIKNIFCSPATANAFNPKVVQATMGSLAHVNVFYTDLETMIAKLKRPLIAASLDGDSIYNEEFAGESILLIGNEANGISDHLLKLATKKITIPRRGNAESLNAAVATGIILSHLIRPDEEEANVYA